MSTFNIVPKLRLYNVIKFKQVDSLPTAATEEGVSLFYSKSDKSGGALYISVKTETNSGGGLEPQQPYEYRAMVNKITGGSGIEIMKNTDDPGEITIIATGGGSGSGNIQFNKIEISAVNDIGMAYTDVSLNATQYVYRGYKIVDNAQELVNVNVYPHPSITGVAVIDFDSSTGFNNAVSNATEKKIYIELLKSTIRSIDSSSRTTPTT